LFTMIQVNIVHADTPQQLTKVVNESCEHIQSSKVGRNYGTVRSVQLTDGGYNTSYRYSACITYDDGRY
jgi:competence transcription factor ComK